MQLIWLFPSLGFSLYLGFVLEQWAAAIFSLSTFALFAIVMIAKNRQVPASDEAPIHFGIKRVAIGNRKLSRFPMLWISGQRERVWREVIREVSLVKSARLLTELQARKFKFEIPVLGGLSFCAGFVGGEPRYEDLVSCGPHALVVGATGSGKSQYLKLFLTSIQSSYQSNPIGWFLIDFKGGATLQQFANGDNCLGFATDLNGQLGDVLDQIVQVMTEREELLAQNPTAKLGKLLVVVDELGPALLVGNALTKFDAIAARGRSLGIHLVAAHQSTSGIPRTLLVNFGMRVALGRVDVVDAAQLGFAVVRANVESTAAAAHSELLSGRVLTAKDQYECVFPVLDATPGQVFLEIGQDKVQQNVDFASKTVVLGKKLNDFSSSF